MAEQQKAKAKGRKIGRHIKSPAMKAYKAELRDQKNKRKAIARHQKTVSIGRFPDGTKVMKVPRGSARAKRRIGIPDSRFVGQEA